MPPSVFTHFSTVLQLVQVIHQHENRFVLRSKVDDESWTLEVGQIGNVTWWRGVFTAKDILGFTGGRKTETIINSFAINLASAIKKGQLSIAKWKDRKEGKQIMLEIDPMANSPIRLVLNELSKDEAGSRAMELLFELFTEAARAHDCQLFLPSERQLQASRTMETEKVARKLEDLQARNNLLQSQLSVAKSSTSNLTSTTTVKPPKRQAGTSLANPTKMARKIQKGPIFESDSE